MNLAPKRPWLRFGPSDGNRRSWSWARFWIAVGLIPLGGACWYLGLAVGLAVGSSSATDDNWLYPIAEGLFVVGPLIVGAGVLWLLVLVTRRLLA